MAGRPKIGGVPIGYRQVKKVYRAAKRGQVPVGTGQYIVRHDITKNYSNPVVQKRR